MNTYFSLLDWSSLFQLLVRFHYEDLIALCKSHNYLYRIICAPYFQECWKKYNIKTIINDKTHIDVDRLGNKHGKVTTYDNDKIIEQYDCIQNVATGMYIERKKIDKDVCIVNGLAHGLTTQCHSNGIEYISYQNGIRHGVSRRYNSKESSNLEDYTDGLKHGIQIDWWSNGVIARIKYFKNGRSHGKETWWRCDGKIREQFYYRDNKLISKVIF